MSTTARSAFGNFIESGSHSHTVREWVRVPLRHRAHTIRLRARRHFPRAELAVEDQQRAAVIADHLELLGDVTRALSSCTHGRTCTRSVYVGCGVLSKVFGSRSIALQFCQGGLRHPS